MQYVSKVACTEGLSPSLPPGCDCARARIHTYPMFTNGTCSTRRSMCMPLPLRSARIPLAVAFRASVQTGASVYARELFACRLPSLPRVRVCRLSCQLSNLHCVPRVHVCIENYSSHLFWKYLANAISKVSSKTFLIAILLK